jgi:hypothetical protein
MRDSPDEPSDIIIYYKYDTSAAMPQGINFPVRRRNLKLPNHENAYIDIRKLTQYALDPTREEGGGKARVFETALGILQEDADYLREAIYNAVQITDARKTQLTPYGQKFEVQFEMTGLNGNMATIITAWIVRNDEDFPRLVTTYVL